MTIDIGIGEYIAEVIFSKGVLSLSYAFAGNPAAVPTTVRMMVVAHDGAYRREAICRLIETTMPVEESGV